MKNDFIPNQEEQKEIIMKTENPLIDLNDSNSQIIVDSPEILNQDE